MNNNPSFICVVLVAASLVVQPIGILADVDVLPGLLKSLTGQRSSESLDSIFSFEKILDSILLDIIPKVLRQRPCNENGTYEQFKDYAMNDNSNDDIDHAPTEDIVKRSGFEYEDHYVESDDGYITQLIRLRNPLVKKRDLKQPPVLLLHGATNDQSVYVWASAIQHHPEKYPRTMKDGPVTSWNRSLAFVLSNNGYDVWLAGTRGSSKRNWLKRPTSALNSFLSGKNVDKNMTLNEGLKQVITSKFYWAFSLDEIIEHEISSQIGKVLQITRARNVSLFSFSQSTITSLAFLSSQPKLAKEKIHNYIVMAPVLNNNDLNDLCRAFFDILTQVPEEIGDILAIDVVLTQQTRNLLVDLAHSRKNRYTFIKLLMTLLFGSSGKYRTILEPAVLGHLYEKVSFRQLKHLAQVIYHKKIQKYDYGPIRNSLIYNQERPPAYNISNIHVRDWFIVSGSNDILGSPSSVNQLIATANPKPKKLLIAKGMSHLDLVAGFDTGPSVNLPIVEFLDEHRLKL